MEEQNNKQRKNHWAKSKVDEATKKINSEIYKRNRQAPIQLKMDDLAIYINDKITRRGIAKGMIFVQEDFNKNILRAEKKTLEILISSDLEFQYRSLMVIKQILKVEIWTDIRFLMINKAITPGEITELIRRQTEIDKDVEKWGQSIQRAISARG
ncbi:MAG: hypothetical protein Q4G09_07320 [Clostridia bacterium]|nr:hypothetical protein [Clostridia bacterium]